MRKRIGVFVFSALLLVVFCRQTVAATVEPDSVSLAVQAGERVHQTVRFENNTGSPQTYHLSVSGLSFGASAEDLHFEPLSIEQQAWIKFDQSTFTTAPQSDQAVEVTVTIPSEAAVDHLNFALLATEVRTDQVGVNISSALASLFFVDIGEQAPVDLRLESFENVTPTSHKLPLKFAVLVSNPGVSIAQPQVGLVVKNVFGRQVAVINLNPTGRRVPGDTSRIFSADWTGGLWRLGIYTVEAVVFPDDSSRVLSASTRVVLFSWPTLLMLGFTIAMIGILGRCFFRWRGR